MNTQVRVQVITQQYNKMLYPNPNPLFKWGPDRKMYEYLFLLKLDINWFWGGGGGVILNNKK